MHFEHEDQAELGVGLVGLVGLVGFVGLAGFVALVGVVGLNWERGTLHLP